MQPKISRIAMLHVDVPTARPVVAHKDRPEARHHPARTQGSHAAGQVDPNRFCSGLTVQYPSAHTGSIEATLLGASDRLLTAAPP